MKCLVSAILLGAFLISVAFGQDGPLRTGYAIVTPISGGRLALSVTETLTERFEGNLVQSNIQPSPLVTLTSMVVDSDPASAANTGIAILNPFDVAATVTLSLVNRQGLIIGARTIIIEARRQRSRFLTELFAGIPELTNSFTGQLLIGSSLPVSVLALAFRGPFFAALPATQLSGNTANDPRLEASALPSALLLPQIAAGGGWVSTITIANVTILPQSVRVDFFDSSGGPPGLPFSSSIPNTIIQPGGVLRFSTGR